jgi:hypothetical protein
MQISTIFLVQLFELGEGESKNQRFLQRKRYGRRFSVFFNPTLQGLRRFLADDWLVVCWWPGYGDVETDEIAI